MANEIKNIFISHIHEDDAGLPDLKNLLEKHGMEARNYSITSDNENNAKDPDYIKWEILAPRIDTCSTLVVYITPDTKSSEWVNWEIDYAFKMEKIIIGVWEQGCKGCAIPEALEECHSAIVGWNGEKIIDAVNGAYKGSYNPDGTPMSKPITFKRHPCG
ncbi:MAG: TIR domain-containing protein [Gammaproteobacteria bacterium]|nr:TIR domain-containing protein [Gammaproteobacteria bacterium]